MRTTFDIDDPVLNDLRRLARREGKSLGRLASDLLAAGLAESRTARQPPRFEWITKKTAPLVDLVDKDAVHEALERRR